MVNSKKEYYLKHELIYFYCLYAPLKSKKTNCGKIKTEVKDPFL
jgi:hypothetical protein